MCITEAFLIVVTEATVNTASHYGVFPSRDALTPRKARVMNTSIHPSNTMPPPTHTWALLQLVLRYLYCHKAH